MKKLWIPLTLIVGIAIGIAAMLGSGSVLNRLWKAPDPVTVASASLDAVREQNRLTPFAARFVAVVTSEQSRFGLSAKKTMILPGLVRYEIDLAKMQERDLAWNADSRTLTVTLPPVELSGPEIDLTALREFQDGRVLMALTDAETQLDAANRTAAREELLRQARGDVPMRLARDASARAIERSFAMPLRAAGIEATVVARFADQ